MKANSYKNHFNIEDENEEEDHKPILNFEESEIEEENVKSKEELDEIELDAKLFQSELNTVENNNDYSIEQKSQQFIPYLVVIVKNNVLRREGPGENYKVNGTIPKHDVFKILEEKKDNLGMVWVKLNFGWIPIGECRKL